MTRTEELSVAVEQTDPEYPLIRINYKTIKQLVELVRLQHEALKVAADKVYSEQSDDEIGMAIAAFNKFEQGGE